MRARSHEADALMAPTGTPLEIRYPVEIGWICVRDAFTGEWHEVLADQVPPWWRRQAQIEKMRRLQATVLSHVVA